MCLCILERGVLRARQLLVQEQLRETFRDRADYRVVIILGRAPAAGRCQAAQQRIQNRQRCLLNGSWVGIHFAGVVQQWRVPLVQQCCAPVAIKQK